MALLGDTSTKVGAGVCGLIAITVACAQIISHIRNYTGPIFQRYIVRLIFMVPLYSLLSFLSLMMPNKEVYFDSARDCYEAWVIYNFLSLCLAYVGGPGSVEVKMNGYILAPSWKYTTCCLPPIAVNGQFVRLCKQGALQFVFLKPVLALLTVVLFTQGGYVEGNWSPGSGYLWITIVYNLTYTMALYALLLFYMGTHELLAPFNPMLKFTVVKLVVFLTFWQGLFISFLVGGGVIDSVRDGKNLQNFLICIEMLGASFGMVIAFPYTEYKTAGPSHGVGLQNMRHVISIRDVVSDTVHQFAPTYHDYVLYSNGNSKGPPKRVQAKTFVAVGHETANKVGQPPEAMESNLLANMELGVHNPNMRSSDDQDEEVGKRKPKFVLDSGLEEGDDDDDTPTLGLQVPLDNEEEEEEEENPSSSAPIASPSVPKAGSILRHADGSGRQSDDVVEGEASAYKPVGEGSGLKRQPWLKGSQQRTGSRKSPPRGGRPPPADKQP